MTWYLSPRVSFAELTAAAAVFEAFTRHGLGNACMIAAGLGVLLSVARCAAQIK